MNYLEISLFQYHPTLSHNVLFPKVMEESLKVILDKHWSTLVRYMNPTQSLISVLVDDRVLPAAMIGDVLVTLFLTLCVRMPRYDEFCV